MLCLKEYGVKLAVVSNFDSRLRKLLKDLNVLHLFDAVIMSSEVGYEKPDEKIFSAALDEICVVAKKVVHVGDGTKVDKGGANAIGIDCWWVFFNLSTMHYKIIDFQFIPVLISMSFRIDVQRIEQNLGYTLMATLIWICRLWGKDVKNFSDIQNRILVSEP
ncbi:hypothetical protein ACS0TY_003663 [Phlomoides rotata]